MALLVQLRQASRADQPIGAGDENAHARASWRRRPAPSTAAFAVGAVRVPRLGAVRYCGQRMRLRDHFTTFSGVAKQIDTSPALIPTTVTPTPVGTGGEPPLSE